MRMTESRLERFTDESGGEVRVRHGNMGEPFREGIDIELANDGRSISAFLEDWEAKRLRDLLLRLYPLPPARS